MAIDRLWYTGILAVMALLVGSFFVFVANIDQSLPAVSLGWLIAILALQMIKLVRYKRSKPRVEENN